VSFGHRRDRRLVALLASGVLDGVERERALAHAATCPRCREELGALRSMLAVVAADPLRSAEPPITPGALAARVRARLDERAARRGRSAWRLSLVSVAAAASLVVALVSRPRVPAPAPDLGADPAEIRISDELMRRMERNLTRERTARYLDEARDVLATVAASPANCDRAPERVDLEEESRRSRELLARRALLVETESADVASAGPVLEDVEHMLREVAGLESCVRPRDVAKLREVLERKRLLMKIRLMSRELAG
jgi:hypothetical protein